MSRLLRAEFARLFHSVVFWLGGLFAAGLGGYFIITRWILYRHLPDLLKSSRAWGDILFPGSFYLTFVIAIVISIFVGTEYSDGTIRNKVMVGHTRKNIFLSKLVVCASADLFIYLLYMAVVLGLGVLLFGPAVIPVKDVLLFTVISCFAVLALTAVYLTFAMLADSRAVASVVCLAAAILFALSAILIYSELIQPEYWEADQITNEYGEVVEVPAQKNPNYASGTKRAVYEFIYDFVPSCQLYQVMMGNYEKYLVIAVYDCVITVTMAGVGMAIFQRKDLR